MVNVNDNERRMTGLMRNLFTLIEEDCPQKSEACAMQTMQTFTRQLSLEMFTVIFPSKNN